jgi:hypothetical protein
MAAPRELGGVYATERASEHARRARVAGLSAGFAWGEVVEGPAQVLEDQPRVSDGVAAFGRVDHWPGPTGRRPRYP